MECLSHRIDQAIRDNLWKPLKLSRDGPPISHLFFADDLVLFAEAGGTQVRIIKQCLDEFCSSSGQRVNYQKSAIFVSANIRRRCARALSDWVGIPLTVDLGRYLGVMAIHGRVTRGRYQDLALRIQKKLAPWKARYLSLASRITLVKSVAASIPVYPMQVELMPKTVCKDLDKINRSFIWGDSEEKRKLHLVGWQTLTLPKDQGGLGIRPSRSVNLAMLAKCGWRLMKEKETLWTQLMRGKYGKNRENLDIIKPIKGSSFTWNSVSKTRELLKVGSGWNIHRGNLTRFWFDVWISQVPLIELTTGPVPDDIRDGMVADFVDEDGNWLTEKFEGLLPDAVTRQITAKAVDPLAGEDDVLFWQPTSDDRFSTKSAFQLMQPRVPSEAAQMWKNIWKLPVPERVRCFMWVVAHDKISINAQLVKRKIASSPCCYRCSTLEETTIHILRDCPTAAFLWARTVPPENQQEFFTLQPKAWIEKNLQVEATWTSEIPWNAFFSIASWNLWKNRNEGVFKGIGKTLSPPSLTQATKIKATLWYKAWVAPQNILGRRGTAVQRVYREISWIPPPAGWIKVNVDGAANGSQGPAGAGGALRNHHGVWIKGFVANLGTCSAIQAELWGIYHGLDMA
ncbi:unnamed protein product [Linum trigynum]|uniref:RNase H type-1 domain-containing protein n=1 Tax=Linum trigynum TaxID=586398 RepID=A0AAV2C6K5_9ROSI